MTGPEWSRRERLDAIGGEDRAVTIEADEAERAALARRFGLVAIERLSADFRIRREAWGILASGRVAAAVTQACSITGRPIAAVVDEPVRLRFVEPIAGGGDEEIELGGDALDTIEIEGGAVDLGEAAAETMALALDPFPRAPEAEAALRAAGVLTEEEARAEGPLAGLAALLGKRTS